MANPMTETRSHWQRSLALSGQGPLQMGWGTPGLNRPGREWRKTMGQLSRACGCAHGVGSGQQGSAPRRLRVETTHLMPSWDRATHLTLGI